MHMFMVTIRLLACMLCVMLGVASLLDAYNGYTMPIYAWYAISWFELVAMGLGTALSTLCLLKHTHRDEYIAQNTSDEEVKPLAPSAREALKQKKAADYVASVSSRGVDFIFFSLLTVTALWIVAQTTFIYEYTKGGQPGYQAALDAGFPTDTPIYFAVFFKLQLMFSLQLQMALSLGICLVGVALSRVSAHHAS